MIRAEIRSGTVSERLDDHRLFPLPRRASLKIGGDRSARDFSPPFRDCAAGAQRTRSNLTVEYPRCLPRPATYVSILDMWAQWPQPPDLGPIAPYVVQAPFKLVLAYPPFGHVEVENGGEFQDGYQIYLMGVKPAIGALIAVDQHNGVGDR